MRSWLIAAGILALSGCDDMPQARTHAEIEDIATDASVDATATKFSEAEDRLDALETEKSELTARVAALEAELAAATADTAAIESDLVALHSESRRH